MTLEQAVDILKTLANGVDPFTGEVLTDDNVCNRTEFVRAVYFILDELSSRKSRPSKDSPGNAGKPWTKEDDIRLAEMYDQGCTREEMESAFQRTAGSISSRLVRLGKIEFRDEYRRRK